MCASAALAACGDSGGSGAAVESEDTGRGTRPTDTGGVDTGLDIVEDVGEPQPPVADAGDDVSGAAGRPLRFDGSGSTDPDGQIVRYLWDLGNGTQLEGEVVNYTFPSEGVYVVSLTVTDDDGLTDRDEITVDLVTPNEAPTAVIQRTFEGQVIAGEEATFTGSDSFDDIGVVLYEWDVGVDGERPIEGEDLAYTWFEPGPVELTLTVEDTDGTQDSATRDLEVLARPEAVVDAPAVAFAGEEVLFDATGSFDPDDESEGAIVGFAWDFVDGSPLLEGPPLPRHTFAEPGEYFVVLVVEDRDGLTGDTAHKITIEPVPNAPPVAIADADRLAEGESTLTITGCEDVVFSAADSYDPDSDDDLTFAWDFGDGRTLPGESVTTAWTETGTFTVTLTVTDIEGDRSTDTITVIVENALPTADFEIRPFPVPLGELAVFDASASEDCEGDIVRYRWDYGDGLLGSTADVEVSHTYDVAGPYGVTLTVVDADEGTDSITRIVDVTESDPEPTSYSGTWTLDEPVSYTCAAILGSPAVNLNFSTVSITDTRPAISVDSRTGQPGTMTGPWSSDVVFEVSRAIPGACTETYLFDGTIIDETTIEYTFTAQFTDAGFGCFDCLESVSFSGTMTRPAP